MTNAVEVNCRSGEFSEFVGGERSHLVVPATLGIGYGAMVRLVEVGELVAGRTLLAVVTACGGAVVDGTDAVIATVRVVAFQTLRGEWRCPA